MIGPQHDCLVIVQCGIRYTEAWYMFHGFSGVPLIHRGMQILDYYIGLVMTIQTVTISFRTVTKVVSDDTFCHYTNAINKYSV